jgi:hypothetical protein
VLESIPGKLVSTGRGGGKVLLGPALSVVIAVINAKSTLARNTVVASEAAASTGLAVARTLVGALHKRVKIVGLDDSANPGVVLGAGAIGAIGASPLIGTVDALVADTVLVDGAHTVARASVLAVAALAVARFVPDNLVPCLGRISGLRSRINSNSGG